MEIIKKFPAEFKIQLIPEMADSLLDMFGLNLQVLFIVKSDLFLHIQLSDHFKCPSFL